MAFADRTTVTVEQTILDIAKIVTKHNGEQFTYGMAGNGAVVSFSKGGRQAKFLITLDPKDAQLRRSRMRALYLVIKAKLEGAEAGVETFEEAFMAQLTLPDGARVGDYVKRELALAYEGGKQPPALLPDFSK